MNTLVHPNSPADADRRAGHLILSWLWLLALPLSFFLGFAAAHVPYAIFGYDEGAVGLPGAFNLLVGVLAIGITYIPVAVSAMLARRALAEGSRAAVVPLAVDGLLTVGALVLLVASTING